MLKIFTFSILSVFIYLSAFPQIQQEDFKVSYPQNVPLNSSFDISFIISNKFPGADTLELYIMPGERISLNSVKLNSLAENLNLNFSSSLLKNYNGLTFKTIINLKDSLLEDGSYFQILMNFKNEDILDSSVKLFGVFKKGSKILGYINSQKKSKMNEETGFINEELDFYEPQNIAGKSLLVKEKASLKVKLKDVNTTADLLIEFWLKLNNSKAELLNVSNNSKINFNFSTNDFQIIACESKVNHQLFSKPDFISLENWNHISILFSFKKNKLFFYNNKDLCAVYNLPALISSKDFSFNFGNADDENNFQLEQLRFINLNNSIEASFRNENFISFNADSSSIIRQFNFDSQNEILVGNSNLTVTSENLKYVKSDAPIFAKAPELNIKMLSNSYELEWSGGDYKQAQTYQLERSEGKSDYVPIFKTQAENDIDKKYSFIDGKDNSSDIIYYRVKQIDKDGSVVYSSQVKVGQGTLDPFVVEQNYPNPFNPKTSIVVDLFEDTELKIIVYNLEGKEVETLFKGSLSKGIHKFSFDAADQPSGVYLYKVETPKYSQTKKMILTK